MQQREDMENGGSQGDGRVKWTEFGETMNLWSVVDAEISDDTQVSGSYD